MQSTKPIEQLPLWRVFLIMGIGLSALGFSPVLVRFASDSSPFWLAVVRTLTSFVILVPFFFWHRRKMRKSNLGSLKKPRSVERIHFWWMALAGMCLGLHLLHG